MSDDESRQPTDPQTPVSRRLVLLLAVTCGAAVANLYYAQPLLHTLAQTFSVSQSTAGLLVTASQIGYAIGLAFLVPLGDLLERRGLIVGILLVCGVGQAVAAAAPNFGVFALALGSSASALRSLRSSCRWPHRWPPTTSAVASSEP
jgi:predicted MFS family arabinose efflux permease